MRVIASRALHASRGSQPMRCTSKRGHAWIGESTAGSMSAEAFVRTHWQRKPWLARSALAGAVESFEPAMLRELACRDDVESRLVRREGRRFSVEHGPFAARALQRLPERGW